MTREEKLKQLFDAALRAPEPAAKPELAKPKPSPSPEPSPVVGMAEPLPVEIVDPMPDVAPQEASPTPMPNAGLDHETSEELGRIIDERHAKIKSKDRRGRLITIAVVGLILVGSGGWFVSDPARVEQLRLAISEIRSVGDPEAMADKYQDALDKIATRNDQVDDAAGLLGVSPDAVQETDDPTMGEEMKTFTGEENDALGARNERFRQRFKDGVAPGSQKEEE